jgi:hypothetical protein
LAAEPSINPLPQNKQLNVISRGHPKKMGHNAMMTEPAQAVVSLDSWLLVLGSVIGNEVRNPNLQHYKF